MSRHHRHHRHEPIPPVPPIPPIPSEGCGGQFRFGDFADMFAMGGRGFRGNWGPFHFDFGDGPGGGGWDRGRRHRGRKRMFESGELRLVLLKLIADEPRHGYDCIRAIEEMTGGEYAPSPGIVYPTLTMLEEMGFIDEQKSKDSKKVFAATDAGREHLDERSDDVEDVMDRLKDLAPDERHSAGPAIGRAVKNLMTAMTQRISRDGFDEELFHEIAAILDEAAQRIERVK
jgi:DNA-binding PadR family transcriptional regulator